MKLSANFLALYFVRCLWIWHQVVAIRADAHRPGESEEAEQPAAADPAPSLAQASQVVSEPESAPGRAAEDAAAQPASTLQGAEQQAALQHALMLGAQQQRAAAALELTPDKQASSGGGGCAPTLKALQAGLVNAINRQDVDALNGKLECATRLPANERQALNLNAAFVPAPPGEGASGGDDSPVNMAGAAAGAGWTDGLQALLAWDASHGDDATLRVSLENDGGRSTPLLHAVKNGHAGAVKALLDANVSLLKGPSGVGETALEVAARNADVLVLRELLREGSVFAHGMLQFRLDLRKRARALPVLVDRWPLGPMHDDGMSFMRDLLPPFMRPTEANASLIVGSKPENMVLLYYNRVMHALCLNYDEVGRPLMARALHRSMQGTGDDTNYLGAAAFALSSNGYASFAEGFSLSVCTLMFVCSFAFSMVYMVFRIRVYGGPQVPISLAHLIPGAFDPIELTAAIFDPARQRSRLQYLTVRNCSENAGSRAELRAKAFLNSFFCVYSSWLFQYVRIPPEKDVYDEEYLSDDDAKMREEQRTRCTRRARLVRSMEVFFRVAAFTVALCWLNVRCQRLSPALALLAAHAVCAVVASTNAAGLALVARSGEASGSAGDPLADAAADAVLTHAVFGVQNGPKWTRTISTTRSTATPNRKAARRRKQNQSGSCSEQSDDADLALEMLHSREEEGGKALQDVRFNSGVPYSYTFQRSALQMGYLHIPQKNYLVRTLGFMALSSFVVIWLMHLGFLCGSEPALWSGYYGRLEPAELFRVYGAPGSWRRWCALAMEASVMAFFIEHLGSIAATLNTAGLVLWQRRRALLFATSRPPPKFAASSGREEPGAQVLRVREATKCVEFIVELSQLRWVVLRASVAYLYLVSLKLLLGGLVVLSEERWHWVETLPAMLKNFLSFFFSSTDSLVVFLVALCLVGPLLAIFFEACLHNAELRRYVTKMQVDSESLESSAGASDEAAAGEDTVNGQAGRLLESCLVCWPYGKEITPLEPALLVGLAFAVAAFSVFNVLRPLE